MKHLTVTEAFARAYPRRAAVLCLKNADGGTDMVLTEWFNWLNTRHQPMISYAMKRTAPPGVNIARDAELCLAFPAADDVKHYKDGVRVTAADGGEIPRGGIQTVSDPELPVLIPSSCDVVLKCTLSGAYNYPFGKVRLFNCNFDDALAPEDTEE